MVGVDLVGRGLDCHLRRRDHLVEVHGEKGNNDLFSQNLDHVNDQETKSAGRGLFTRSYLDYDGD